MPAIITPAKNFSTASWKNFMASESELQRKSNGLVNLLLCLKKNLNVIRWGLKLSTLCEKIPASPEKNFLTPRRNLRPPMDGRATANACWQAWGLHPASALKVVDGLREGAASTLFPRNAGVLLTKRLRSVKCSCKNFDSILKGIWNFAAKDFQQNQNRRLTND